MTKRTLYLLIGTVFMAIVLTAAESHAQNFAGTGPIPKDNAGDSGQESPAPADDAAEAQGELTDEELIAMTRPAPGGEDSSTYTLGPTDVIEITVMRHPEVSGQYFINNEGKIQYEFVGDVVISGLTKDGAAEAVSKRLSEYIINPEVTVKISGYNSKVVYVVGEVNSPGKIFMRGDTITVREALLQAGLPMLTGVTKKSRLITPSETGHAPKKEVNVYALLYEGDLRENFTMQPGDVLYIPPTFLTKAMRAIQPVASPVGTAAGTARTVVTPIGF